VPSKLVVDWLGVYADGSGERNPGVERVRVCPAPGLLVSKTAINSVARPGRGRSVAPGSVEAREWEDVFPSKAERRNVSGRAAPEAEKAPELGLEDSSVLSVILLKRATGLGIELDVAGRAVEVVAVVGKETKEGDPV
jgi:hypothetical protein